MRAPAVLTERTSRTPSCCPMCLSIPSRNVFLAWRISPASAALPPMATLIATTGEVGNEPHPPPSSSPSTPPTPRRAAPRPRWGGGQGGDGDDDGDDDGDEDKDDGDGQHNGGGRRRRRRPKSRASRDVVGGVHGARNRPRNRSRRRRRLKKNERTGVRSRELDPLGKMVRWGGVW